MANNSPEKELDSPKMKNWQKYMRIEPMLVLFNTSVLILSTVLPQHLRSMAAAELGYNETGTSNENDTSNICVRDESISYESHLTYSYDLQSPILMNYAQDDEVTEGDVLSLYYSWFILILVTSLGPTILLVPFIGSWSDKVGRKKALTPALLACTVRSIIYFLVEYFKLSIWVLIAAGLIEGLTGGTYTVITIGYAYLLDMSPPDKKAKTILILQLCSGFLNIVTNILLGFVIDIYGFGVPIFTTAVITTILALYTIFLLPESKTHTHPAKFFSLDNIKKIKDILYSKKIRYGIYIVLLMDFLFSVCGNGAGSITSTYFLNYPLFWDSILIGIYNSYDFVIEAIGGIITLRFLHKRLGDVGVLIFTAFGLVGVNVFLAFSDTTLMVFLATMFTLTSKLWDPLFRSILSGYVTQDDLGSMMSVLTIIGVLPLLFANSIFGPLYAETVDWFRGFALLVVAACYTIPLILLLLFRYWREKGIIAKSIADEESKKKEKEKDDTYICTKI